MKWMDSDSDSHSPSRPEVISIRKLRGSGERKVVDEIDATEVILEKPSPHARELSHVESLSKKSQIMAVIR